MYGPQLGQSHSPNLPRLQALPTAQSCRSCASPNYSLLLIPMVTPRWTTPLFIVRLKKLVARHKFLHTRLAEIYVQKREFGEAVFHYNAALRENLHDLTAINGLKRAERWMQGLDPSDDEQDDLDDDDLVLDE